MVIKDYKDLKNAFKNNNYYNACLLSSTLLQAKIGPNAIIDALKDTKYSIITDYIDQNKIDKFRNRNTGRVVGYLKLMIQIYQGM